MKTGWRLASWIKIIERAVWLDIETGTKYKCHARLQIRRHGVFQNGRSFFWHELGCDNRPLKSAPCEDGMTRCAEVTHPIDFAKCGEQVQLTRIFECADRGCARSADPAAFVDVMYVVSFNRYPPVVKWVQFGIDPA